MVDVKMGDLFLLFFVAATLVKPFNTYVTDKSCLLLYKDLLKQDQNNLCYYLIQTETELWRRTVVNL